MKNIVVAFDGTRGACAALRYAAELAGPGGGHVTAVLAHAATESYAAQGNWIPAEVRQILGEVNDRIVVEAKSAFEAEAATLGLGDRLAFEALPGRVDDVLSRRARASDLLVAPRPTGEADIRMLQHPDQIALRSGRPLLIVPPGASPSPPPAETVIAWDGKRAAARALADALPLLAPGSRVTLLTVGPLVPSIPPEAILTHLSRHGFDARQVTRPAEGSIANTVIAYCDETRPGLLVLGAFEHSKFQVELMGGATTEVLRRAELPVLMSH